MAALTETEEATHDVAMKVDVRMVHHTWDVPAAPRRDDLVRWMRAVGDREIAMQLAARGKAGVRVLVAVPEVGEKATVVMLAVGAGTIHGEDHNGAVLVVIVANQRWLADVALMGRRHSVARDSVDRVDRLRSRVSQDVRHLVADRRSPAHLSSLRERDDHSRAVSGHRRSVVRKVDRHSNDHPDVDRTHVVTVEMDLRKVVADMELGRVMAVAEARREVRQTDVVIDVRTHETASVMDHPTVAADRNHARVMIVAEAHREARGMGGEIEAQDRMHETAGETDHHPELTDQDDVDQTAIPHATAIDDPTEIGG